MKTKISLYADGCTREWVADGGVIVDADNKQYKFSANKKDVTIYAGVSVVVIEDVAEDTE